jgi:putative tryptophan/tyrosine transport system substrate-binding protein
MNRREIIAALGATAVSPFSALAQLGEQMHSVGVLMSFLQDDPAGIADVEAFRRRLTELGWVEGRNIRIEFRWPGSDVERARVLAKELVALKPDVLLARSTPTTAALKRETDTIPIVFVNIAEPIDSGFVQTLARPGGNTTGFTNFESSIGGKWLQLLKEAAPALVRIAIIYNPQTAPFAGLYLGSVQSAAPSLALQIVDMPVHSDSDIAAAVPMFAREPGGGLIAIPDTFTIGRRDTIIALAARLRLPALYPSPSFTPSGGLMAYAVDTRDAMRRAAGYVDRILKGAKPADLPVQAPAKFELSINLKTAKALGLDLAPMLLARADEVIE